MADIRTITPPLTDEVVASLRAGDQVYITGPIYSARDAAHKRLVEALDRGEKLPFDIKGAIIYYVGPSPTKPGNIIGSAGPTTSGRMDAYTPRLLAEGMKGCIGKGSRIQAVRDALQQYKGVYFGAIGGAAVVISKAIKKVEPIAYEDLGAEAIVRMTVENFLVNVVNDIYGNDLFEQGKLKYRRVAS